MCTDLFSSEVTVINTEINLQQWNDPKLVRNLTWILNLMFDEPCIIVITEESKNQLDATYYFIVLVIGSICFGHYCAVIRSSRL